MRIEVKDQGFEATEGLKNYVGLRLMSVLDHLVRRVNGVTVCLADVHVSDAGGDGRCRMVASLAPSGEVRVEETDPSRYAAIDRAAERLALGVALELARPAMRGTSRLGQMSPGAVEQSRRRTDIGPAAEGK